VFSLSMEHVNLSTRCCVVGQLNPGAQRHVRSARITTRFWKVRRLYLNNLQKKNGNFAKIQIFIAKSSN